MTATYAAARNLWTGILFGFGLAAFIDEAVFHQILHWHHFYDKSTMEIGLVSDGLFHAASWLATVGSLFLLANLRRRSIWQPLRWFGGVLLGTGGFNLYDGIIHHKIMRLHQVRYGVDLLPYDLIWNLTALVLFLAGIIIMMRTQEPKGETVHAK